MAELGVIAGCGMGIAYLASMLLLPALLRIFSPPAEPHPLGYLAMAPVDRSSDAIVSRSSSRRHLSL
jgi:hypothetical protein